jgi:2-keto-4-pentenoate hydratase
MVGQTEAETVTAFRSARCAATALTGFPGPFPTTLAEAYALQDRAVAEFPDTVRGWKVAGVLPELRAALGTDRIVGPVFSRSIRRPAEEGPVAFPVFPGGFAAVEAEFILEMGRDISPCENPDAATLAGAVRAMHAGVETAGSPLATINDLGPLAVVSDFGNNHGIIVGPEITDWRARDLAALAACTSINGMLAGEGSAAKVAGGPLAALAFLVGNLGARGIVLRAGDYVSTGMTTGIHLVVPGDLADFQFVDGIRFQAEAILARAQAVPRQQD